MIGMSRRSLLGCVVKETLREVVRGRRYLGDSLRCFPFISEVKREVKGPVLHKFDSKIKLMGQFFSVGPLVCA